MYRPTLARRGVLSGGSCVLACASAALGQPKPQCTDLTEPPTLALDPAQEERHTIFLLLTMALVHDGWGVDRRRPEQVALFAAAEPSRRFPDYLGHNIGALLVDGNAHIVCFALNRSVQLNSTLEHAEARAVRNAIQIANSRRPPGHTPPWSFGNLLSADRLYTTLEPCSQCSGIMDLANLSSVIYAQDDPGQHHITNIIYNLRHDGGPPGMPIPVRAVFLPLWNDLSSAYRRFVADASPGSRTGLTSFLETVEAYRIFRTAAGLFTTAAVQHQANTAVLQEALAFRARWQGRIESGAAPV